MGKIDSKCETSLELTIDLGDGVENETSLEIDQDIFLLAFILQILRQCCD